MNIINNKLYEKHLEAIQNDKAVRKQLCVNDFATSDLERTVATKSAEITEQIAIEFGKFISNHRLVFQPSTNGRFIGLDMKNYTSEELFQEFLKQRQ